MCMYHDAKVGFYKLHGLVQFVKKYSPANLPANDRTFSWSWIANKIWSDCLTVFENWHEWIKTHEAKDDPTFFRAISDQREQWIQRTWDELSIS